LTTFRTHVESPPFEIGNGEPKKHDGTVWHTLTGGPLRELGPQLALAAQAPLPSVPGAPSTQWPFTQVG
jgi:hypothetical protein